MFRLHGPQIKRQAHLDQSNTPIRSLHRFRTVVYVRGHSRRAYPASAELPNTKATTLYAVVPVSTRHARSLSYSSASPLPAGTVTIDVAAGNSWLTGRVAVMVAGVHRSCNMAWVFMHLPHFAYIECIAGMPTKPYQEAGGGGRKTTPEPHLSRSPLGPTFRQACL